MTGGEALRPGQPSLRVRGATFGFSRARRFRTGGAFLPRVSSQIPFQLANCFFQSGKGERGIRKPRAFAAFLQGLAKCSSFFRAEDTQRTFQGMRVESQRVTAFLTNGFSEFRKPWWKIA